MPESWKTQKNHIYHSLCGMDQNLGTAVAVDSSRLPVALSFSCLRSSLLTPERSWQVLSRPFVETGLQDPVATTALDLTVKTGGEGERWDHLISVTVTFCISILAFLICSELSAIGVLSVCSPGIY